MSLSTKLAGNFTKNVRKRGDDYYCKGRVMIHEGSQSELTARVRGSGFYEVQFAWRNNKLAVWCDCPHFVEQGVPCKHVWATTLAADQHQYLIAAPRQTSWSWTWMLLAQMVLMAVTITMAMKNSMRKTERRRSFHRVLPQSCGMRQSRNHRTGVNNWVRSFRLEPARLGRPSWRSCMSWMPRKTCTAAIWFSHCNRATGTPTAVSRDPKFFP